MAAMKPLARSLRILRKNWKLTGIAIFSLSIAMALAVVSLSVSNTSLLVPPAGVQPDRLVSIYSKTPGTVAGAVSYPDYQYYRDNNRVFSGVAGIAEEIAVIRTDFGAPGQKDAPLITIAYNPVSENYFSVLGLHPFLGRLFAAGDDNSKSSIAVMTYSCWKRLGSDSNVVGKVVGSFTIVGVAPKEFTGSLFGINGDLLVPLSGAQTSENRTDRHLYLLARLKPGVTRTQAQADLAVLSRQLGQAYPKDDKDWTAVVTRATLLPPNAIPAAEMLAAILLFLVSLVLLIACANVANLLLALGVGRRQEATIKLALGAPRSRLICEFLCEGAILCAISTVVGYGLAIALANRYSALTVNVPMLSSYSLSMKLHFGIAVLAATVALMLIAILATGLPAALYASSGKVAQILSGEIVVGGTRKAMRRNALVVIQISVCTLVLICMGICERSLYNLRQVNPGFSARNIITEDMPIAQEGHAEKEGRALYEKIRQEVAAIPGIDSVALGDPPIFGSNQQVSVQVPGTVKPTSVDADGGVADANYFATLEIPVLSGRVFNSSDVSGGADVLVVNRKLAEMLWPGQDAVGRELLTGNPQRRGIVIGVVATGKYGGSLDEEAQPYFYYDLSQHYAPEINVIARTKGDPRLWVQPLTHAIQKTGLLTPLDPMTFQDIENVSLLPERIIAGAVTGLSVLALLLAIVGLFGAISYSVSERKKELGIRVALGAQPWQLLEMIFRQTLLVAGAGTAIGVAMGIAATILLRSQFFGVGAIEFSVLIPVAVAMLGVSLAVAYISARPWIKADPMEAVRHA